MVEARAEGHRAQVDVVVPTFNNREPLMQSIAALDDPVVDQVIVVDDVSADDTIDALARGAPHVTVVALEEHRGLAHAFNAGVARGEAPYVLFLNDDVIATEGAVARLAGHLRERRELAFAGGRLVDAETLETQREYNPRTLPSTIALVIRVIGVERYWRRNPFTGRHLSNPLSEDAPSTISLQPAGACLLIRRSALKEAGGWDEGFWFWYEDVDVVARLLPIGAGVWDPAAVFRHVGRHSTRSWDKPAQHSRLYHSTLRYAQRHSSGVGARVVAIVVLIACRLRVPFYALRRRSRAAAIYRELSAQALAVLMGTDAGAPSPMAVPRRTRRRATGSARPS